ncbi:MAG: activase [Desulfobacteraceae bacterium]|nr:activase [Desulfobacteraceae bacterium]
MGELITSVGLCLGASTVSVVRLSQEIKNPRDNKTISKKKPLIVDHKEFLHDGDPKQTLLKALESIQWNRQDKIAATGRKFSKLLNLSSITEPQAVEYAFAHARPDDTHCPAVICAGGETFMVYVLDKAGKISNVLTGNKCASGTGEFFLQQLRRLDVSLAQAAQWSTEPDPYPVSGRCSVFCKSDCTHATNKGISRSRVTAGLGRMMANKILELLKTVEPRNLMLTGGTARNQMMVRYLEDTIPGLIVPRQAAYFEALGAALWALEHDTKAFPGFDKLFFQTQNQFNHLAPLAQSKPLVDFKTIGRDTVRNRDVCLLGLDVGSTTTKAVLIRHKDQALLASVYLRTNGDPVGASRLCYQGICDQVSQHADPDAIRISGLGVCGSGRQIAGLHAMTDGVINEIIAHAAAAVYFDPDVDTLFEIGGQDAKYTYITNGVPSDYAMNEACSAGTGSFLEESALETLGVPMEKIAPTALLGDRPPNFNDQCAAFIASDIKNAIHDGIGQENIVAGLVYSVCINYTNRVKGNRPVGRKVFMQGGVCYNQAVPLAMAELTGKPIIVPPEPGLMGAFGAALEVKKRLAAGLLQPSDFNLQHLAKRQVSYGKPFICKGGKEHCDRGCEICRIRIDGRTYPFGGACNRYNNLRRNKTFDANRLNLVNRRQELIFKTFAPQPLNPQSPNYRGRIGINRSFLVNTYYPLYAHFFSGIGYEPVVPETADQKGIDQRNAQFCYPAELAHGFFHNLIFSENLPDILFLPHFKAVPTLNGTPNSQVCPLVQGETFYLQTTFRNQLQKIKQKGIRLFDPIINMGPGLHSTRQPLMAVAEQLGVPRSTARKAFDKALLVMNACLEQMRALGREALQMLSQNPDQLAVVLFGRSYNAFSPEAHMGIPHKLATRGIMVISHDCLDPAGSPDKYGMYWGMGQSILKISHKVKNHEQLFGTYITNFSCGPDSFLITYFRDIMGRKPSLTLELDSHTADAGLETRIEAFIDIAKAYRKLEKERIGAEKAPGFKPAYNLVNKKNFQVRTSDGSTLEHTHERVTLLFPSMGEYGSKALSAVLQSFGFNTVCHDPADEKILKLGRSYTSCKECLPLLLTTGTLLNYLNHRSTNEVVLYFMPTGSGPCRFGQYSIFMKDLIRKLQIPNVTTLSLSSDDGYIGLPANIHRRAWWAVVISDVFEDMHSMLLVNAKNPNSALQQHGEHYDRICKVLVTGNFNQLKQALKNTAQSLSTIELKKPIAQVPIISLSGEIFVRRDNLSRQFITHYLADKGFAAVCAPVAEWIQYSDWLINKGFDDHNHSGIRAKLAAQIKQYTMNQDEKLIKGLLSCSGLIHAHPVHIEKIVQLARPYISPHLGGEAILTVGTSLKEVGVDSCGVIAIGPFGCMPNRISESILSEVMTREDKLCIDPENHSLRATLTHIEQLPFLAIESDGSAFPQLINAKLEAFCLRAHRMHEKMLSNLYAN